MLFQVSSQSCSKSGPAQPAVMGAGQCMSPTKYQGNGTKITIAEIHTEIDIRSVELLQRRLEGLSGPLLVRVIELGG